MRARTVHVKSCSPLTSFALHTDCIAWKCISEHHVKPASGALKLGRKGKTAGNVHYLKCCRMRNRCWHGICGVASYTAYAGSWQVTQLTLAVGKLNWYQTHSYAKPTTTTGIQAGRASQQRAIMGAEIFSLLPFYLHPGRDQSREREIRLHLSGR